MKIHRTLITLALSLAAMADASAQLLINGSFEDPVAPTGSFLNYFSGSTAITGWTVFGGDAAVIDGNFTQSGITFAAQDGNQWIDLAGVSFNAENSGVTQDITTVIGQQYEVSFYVGSATDGVFFFPATVRLSINGGTATSHHNPATPTTTLDWMLFTVPFIATSTTTNLAFLNGSAANNYNTALDNVSVTGVPEPSTALLGMFGLTGILLRRDRRRNAS